MIKENRAIKVMTVFGTRPEAIKMAPVVNGLVEDKAFKAVTVVTAQHREMLDQVLEIFDIKPDYDLNIMKSSQTLTDITVKVLTELKAVIATEKPDIVLVHGDTTTTFAASLSAFYQKIAVGHVEAGLRTWNKYSPFPEELNRQITDDISSLYFAPTQTSKKNLVTENHESENIFVTGNTAIDALKHTISDTYNHDVLKEVKVNSRMILVTMHRRENLGRAMEETFAAINDVTKLYDDVEVVFPMHLNPKVRSVAKKSFENNKKVHLIEPLDVVDFHNMAAKSYFIMTDSGGVQEEAPALHKPVLVLRDTTERPEGIKAGTLKLVGTEYENVKNEMISLLSSRDEYQKMASAVNPYGDGEATKRILNAIKFHFNVISSKPNDFL